jgi:hypothetical protein
MDSPETYRRVLLFVHLELVSLGKMTCDGSSLYILHTLSLEGELENAVFN